MAREYNTNLNYILNYIGEGKAKKIAKDMRAIQERIKTANKELKEQAEGYAKLGSAMKEAVLKGGLPSIEKLRESLQKKKEELQATKDSMSDYRVITKQLGVPIGILKDTLLESGVAINKQGKLINTATGRAIPYTKAIDKIIAAHSTWGGVMTMNRDVFIAMRKKGYEFLGTGAKLGMWVRGITEGMHGFKMELLSVMFFGMQMQQLGMGMLRPAMQMYGITELFSTVLAVVMLPIMKHIFPILLGISKTLLGLDPASKMVLGLGAVFLAVGGAVLWFGAQLGLFIGAVPEILAAVTATKKRFRRLVGFLKDAGTSMINYARTKLWPKLAGIFGKGMDLLGLKMKRKGIKLNNIFSRTGNKLAGRSKMIGMATSAGFAGPIGLALMAVLAAVVIFAAAWAKNWFGIRQKTGRFVVWFSGIYDKVFKPALISYGSGIIAFKNVVSFALGNIKNIWSFVWLNMQSVAFRTWNALLTGVETFVNGMLAPFRALYEKGGSVAKGAAKIFGFELPEFPEFDLSAFKASTDEVDSQLNIVKNNLKKGFKDVSSKTREEVTQLTSSLSGLTVAIKEWGEGMIESGNKMDAEREAKEANAESTNKLGEIVSGFTDMLGGSFIPTINESTSSINTNTKAILDTGNEAINTMPKINDLNITISDTNTKTKEVTETLNDRFKPALEDQQEILGEVQTAFSNTTSRVNEYISTLKKIPRDIYTTIHKTVITTEKRRRGGLFGLGFFGLQHGGIVTRPILATLAERGPEAVIPLDRTGGATSTLGRSITIHNTYNISGVSSPEDVEAKIEEANAKLIDDLKAMIR